VQVFNKEVTPPKKHWEFYNIRAMVDPEEPMYFVHDQSNEHFTEWSWEDLGYFIKLEQT